MCLFLMLKRLYTYSRKLFVLLALTMWTLFFMLLYTFICALLQNSKNENTLRMELLWPFWLQEKHFQQDDLELFSYICAVKWNLPFRYLRSSGGSREIPEAFEVSFLKWFHYNLKRFMYILNIHIVWIKSTLSPKCVINLILNKPQMLWGVKIKPSLFTVKRRIYIKCFQCFDDFWITDVFELSKCDDVH